MVWIGLNILLNSFIFLLLFLFIRVIRFFCASYTMSLYYLFETTEGCIEFDIYILVTFKYRFLIYWLGFRLSSKFGKIFWSYSSMLFCIFNNSFNVTFWRSQLFLCVLNCSDICLFAYLHFPPCCVSELGNGWKPYWHNLHGVWKRSSSLDGQQKFEKKMCICYNDDNIWP